MGVIENMIMNERTSGPVTSVLLVFLFLTTGGCRSLTQPAGASFASVEITGYTSEQIRGAVSEVFREDGFTVTSPSPSRLVCEREGSRLDNLAYGDWMGDSSVAERVKVEILALANLKYRVQCNAFMVRDPHGLEDEVKLRNTHRLPYQNLLDKVAARLR
jgi:hypothetical protein